MPLPLKAGYNFGYSHFCRPPHFEMTAPEAYTDFYGLSYTVSGENLCYSLEGVSVFQAGDRKRAGKKLVADKEKKQDKLICAIEYVKEYLFLSPSLQETAEHIHVSPSYLSKMFINRLHTPYSAFVLNEKILYAQKLLVNSDKDMMEIAERSGFSSNTYFSDCFKRVTGMSPLQFRKEDRRSMV